MLKVLYQRLYGSLLTDIASSLTLLPVDLSTLATIQANVNFVGGEWTYLKLYNSAYSEEVKVTGVSGTYLIIERGKSGSTPMAFAAVDTNVSEVTGVDAITDIIANNPSASAVTVAGLGIALVTNVGDAYTVNVPAPVLTGVNGIEILGAYPNIQVALETDAGGCCPGEGPTSGSGLDTLLITSTILQGSLAGGLLTLLLETPIFTGAGTVSITGAWPNYTITGSGGGGSGTVTSVSVGAGLTLTGSPSVNPTVAITNTGVTAGDYSGFVVNSRGQITSLPVGFAPISSIVMPDSGDVTRVGGVVTITLRDAAVGVKGVVVLADSGSPLNPLDDTSAVTPAMLAAATTTSSASSVAGTSTGEADASYTDIITGASTTLTLAAGEKAIVFANVVILNDTTPLTPEAFGIAVFDAGGVKKAANKKATQSNQSLVGSIDGPFTGALTVRTTALPAGSTLHTAKIAVIKI